MSAERFGVGLSVEGDPARAAAEAAEAASAALGPGPASLVVAFASPETCEGADDVVAAIHARLAPDVLIGAMGEAVIGRGREVEGGPALALWAARLPGASITPFHLVARPTDGGIGLVGWPAELEHAPPPEGPVIMLADPFTFPADALLGQLNLEGRGVHVVGGLASGGRGPGEHRLFFGREVLDAGAVGVVVRGPRVVTVVSQGCAPIGPDMVITAAEGSTVEELAGVPALRKLEEVVASLPEEERAMASVGGLLAGLVINENQPTYERGDYLIRGIHGGDPLTGSLHVGERVRVGQTFRFHVRDAVSADDDLREAVRDARRALGRDSPAGGLIFSCNGRGTRMFATSDHDAVVVSEELGAPAAGLFCNGELGPVGGKNFLHGFTATMALFGGDE
jgi:small ligand-binding sensory domain FIST